ncbi:MAG: pilus assembly protein PilY, partial [Betaproteobacteria bacterium]|nr:pilus assembly protein PilY [Betaproteobacteria bacterium]
MLAVFRRNLIVVTFLSIISAASIAEDIDLFTGVAPSSSSDVPNVLIILDNTANWNTAFTNEIHALSTVLSGLAVNKFRVGLMMFSETGSDNKNPDGAYVRAAIRLMNSTNKPIYQNLVNSLHVLNDKSNGGKLGLTMAEAYYYFSGMNAYAGYNKAKRDFAGNTSGTIASNAIYALSGNALSSSSDTVYESPVSSGCQKNFIIYISNGPVQDNSSDTSTANSKLSAAGGSTSQIPISPSGSQSNSGDEWARFMANSSNPQIITYTVDVDPGATGQGPGFSALLKSMASQGKGKYFAVNSSIDSGSQISVALNQIFSEIQAKNSVFSSASLPVSVNTQGTYLNQIFVGMFRPDATASPRWPGNLKQYQFKPSLVNNKIELKLADADGALAINNTTGFITQCARSFWTPSTTSPDTYWSFAPQGSCLAVANSEQSNTPDGEVVEKGAAA